MFPFAACAAQSSEFAVCSSQLGFLVPRSVATSCSISFRRVVLLAAVKLVHRGAGSLLDDAPGGGCHLVKHLVQFGQIPFAHR